MPFDSPVNLGAVIADVGGREVIESFPAFVRSLNV